MKKILLASLLALSSGLAVAQSSVTLYGNLDATDVYMSGGAGKSNALQSNANSTSLWGITGVEDLGGGLKAAFDLKSEINLATGQTGSTVTTVPTNVITTTPSTSAPVATGGPANLFNRGANLSLGRADVGEVKVGRMDDIEWAMSGSFSTSNSSSFGSGQGHAVIGNPANTGVGTCATGTAGVAGNGICSTLGYIANNYSYSGTSDAFIGGIQYTSPSFSGVTVKVQSGMGANSATANMYAGNTQGAGIFYKGLGGRLDAALATSRRSDDTGALGLTLTSLGAKYKATDKITVTGIYSWAGLSNQTVTAMSGGPNAQGANAGNTMYSVGINYQVTPAADISLAYTNVTADTVATSSSSATGNVAGLANSAVIYGLTGRYNFSKRTQLYAGIGQSNNTGAYFVSPIYGSPSYAGSNIGTGGNIFASMVGLRHQF